MQQLPFRRHCRREDVRVWQHDKIRRRDGCQLRTIGNILANESRIVAVCDTEKFRIAAARDNEMGGICFLIWWKSPVWTWDGVGDLIRSVTSVMSTAGAHLAHHRYRRLTDSISVFTAKWGCLHITLTAGRACSLVEMYCAMSARDSVNMRRSSLRLQHSSPHTLYARARRKTWQISLKHSQ